MTNDAIQADRMLHAIGAVEYAATALLYEQQIGDSGRNLMAARTDLDALDSLVALLRARTKPAVDPIRTIHHLACTGGTIISKAIATLPNVHLLSEADPLSVWPYRNESVRFFPTDMIGLLRSGTRDVDADLLLDVFRAAVDVVHRHDRQNGRHLVIRDHAHSQFCYGPRADKPRGLRDALPRDVPHRAVVTVRHPIDSFSSLQQHGWLQFTPSSLDEYAERYLQFLEEYSGIPMVKYEEFVSNPAIAIRTIGQLLELPVCDFEPALVSHYSLSGDSGRKGDAVSPRTRRASAQQILDEARSSKPMKDLCKRLNYTLNSQ